MRAPRASARSAGLLAALLLPAAAPAGEAAKKTEVITIDADRAFEKDFSVKPGVTLSFAGNAGIICRGIMEARGTREKPITFTARAPAKGWKNLALVSPGTEGSMLEHCRFSGGRGRRAKFDKKLALLEFPKPDEGEGIIINCGGALFIYGAAKVEVRSCRFEKNSAYWGAALSCWGRASPTISGCVFTGNGGENTEDAGAVHCVLRSNPVISGNYISGNTAKYGGAIHCLHGSAPVISGNYISGNRARGSSSAISCFNRAGPTISGNFISGNTVERDKGVAIETVVHSQPVIKGNYIKGNSNQKDKEANLRANKSFQGKPDESTCEEQEPAKKEDILGALKKAGVLDLAPGPARAPAK